MSATRHDLRAEMIAAYMLGRQGFRASQVHRFRELAMRERGLMDRRPKVIESADEIALAADAKAGRKPRQTR